MPKVLVHNEDAPAVAIHDLGPKETAADVAAALGVDLEGREVWIGDNEEPVDIAQTLATVEGVGEGTDVTIARKGKIHVTVDHNGAKLSRDFGPHRKVRRVFRWAVGTDGFDLASEQRPDHELAVAGHDEAAEMKTPISVFADEERAVSFVLRRKDGYQG